MSQIKSIIRATEYQLNIKWRLTDCCNYNCSYCIRKDKLDNIKNIKSDQKLIEDTIPEIARLILESNKTTRIELIGGEVSILDLETILLNLFKSTNNLIKRINITSNFSRDVSYYNNLIDICTNYGVELFMTFSWHKEYTQLNSFIDKLKLLTISDFISVKVEMVNTLDNKKDVNDFIEICSLNNIDYSVDADVNVKVANNLITTTNERKKPGYIITKDDNTIETCNSIRELVKKYGIYETNKIMLKDYYCTLDYNYVYVDKNLHIGYNKWANKCKIPEPISDFHLLKEPIICPKGCSLCGHMSVSKNKEELIEWYESIKKE